MNIARFIEDKIKSQGLRKNWVAERIGVNYKTFVARLKQDNLTAHDLFSLSKLLDFELIDIEKEIVNKFVSENNEALKELAK